MNCGYALMLLAACSDPNPPDACTALPVVAGGSAEIGHGSPFSPITDGQEVRLELGVQGLWMFVVDARVRDMDVGAGDLGGVFFTGLDAAGAVISLELGCRTRDFVDTGDNAWQLASPYFLAFSPSVTVADGTAITLRLDVRDQTGRQASDVRTVFARRM